MKRAIWLAVIVGMLYVLISPLPEVAATLNGKSFVILVVLVSYLIPDLLFSGFLFVQTFGRAFAVEENLLTRLCTRLC